MIRASLAASLPLALLGVIGVSAPSARADGPPDIDLHAAPPLSIPAADLLAIANADPAPKDEDLEYLLDSVEYTCDDAGRCDRVSHDIIRVLTERGARWKRTFSERWKPGYDARPELRARVVRADGRQSELDMKTVSEQPVAASDDVYTDYRQLVAPLPAVAPGAVIETWSKRTEERPAFASGRTFHFTQDVPNPTRRIVKQVSGPRGMKLRIVQAGPAPDEAVVPHVSTEDGRKVLRIDGRPKMGPFPLYDPPSRSSWSWVAVSTAASWQAAAAEYAAIVDKVLAAPGVPEALQKLADEVIGDATAPDAIIARIHAWIAAKLRYTSIALGDGAWTPTAPPEVVKRAYGDCKDFATLVVGLLRARKITAHVALTRVNRTRDPLADVPGLDWFDHAIVFVPGDTPRWLDPTAAVALEPGTLSNSYAGRWALVARPEETALSRLPPVGEEGWQETRELTLHRDGPADLVETTVATGTSAGSMRAWYKGNRIDEQPGFWMSYVKSGYGDAADARLVELVGQAPAVDPFTLSIGAKGLEDYALSAGDGRFELPPGAVLDRLPEALRKRFGEETADDRAWKARWLERSGPLDLGFVERTEVTWRVHLPRGVTPAGDITLPESFTVGPVRFEATTKREGDVVEVSFLLDVAPGTLTGEQVVALNTKLVALGSSKVPVLAVQDEVGALVDAHDIGGALKLAQEIVREAPDEMTSWRWLYVALSDAGLVDAAKETAREMARRWPGESLPHLVLGYALLRDGIGRAYKPGFDPHAAREALRAGLAIDPDNVAGHTWLAEALIFDPEGGGEAKPEPGSLEAGMKELAWLRDHDETSLSGYELQLLLEQKKPREAIEVAAKLPSSTYRDRVLVAATALVDGATAALAKQDELGGSVRDRLIRLAWAAVDTARFGKPGVALDVLATFPGKDEQLALIRELYRRRRDAPKAPTKGACAEAITWFAHYGGRAGAGVEGAIPKRYHGSLGVPRTIGAFAYANLRKSLLEDGAAEDAMLIPALKCEAGDTTERLVTPVTVTVDVEGAWKNIRSFAFVRAAAKRGAQPEVLPATPLFIGSEALRALAKGKLKAARALLSWGVEAGSASAIAPVLVALGHEWDGSTIGTLDAKGAGAVAAVWAPDGPEAKAARKRIEALLKARGTSDELKSALDDAYTRALAATGAYEEAVTRIEAAAAAGKSVIEMGGATAVAMDASKYEGREALLKRLGALGDERLKQATDLGALAFEEKDEASRAARTKALLEAYAPETFAGQRVRNSVAWRALFIATDLKEALALVDAIPERDSATEHTRATILAALDRPVDAMVSLETAIGKRERVEPYDDVVFGRVAQSYGLFDTARWYYDRVMAGPSEDEVYPARELARRWRESLPEGPDEGR